jgi:hypothetical protein
MGAGKREGWTEIGFGMNSAFFKALTYFQTFKLIHGVKSDGENTPWQDAAGVFL